MKMNNTLFFNTVSLNCLINVTLDEIQGSIVIFFSVSGYIYESFQNSVSTKDNVTPISCQWKWRKFEAFSYCDENSDKIFYQVYFT